jgi:predicted lactoylglutathione lyase
MKKIYINIPVKNLASSEVFYKTLGFEKQEDFSDENGVGMKWSDDIFVMLLTHDFAKNFIEEKFR